MVDVSTLLAVRGLETTSPAFRQGVVDMARRLNVDPDWLVTVMSFESAGTFSPSIRNPSSGATGLIQFLGSTAVGLGTTLDALAAMTAEEQLFYVEKYLTRVGKPLRSLDDVYLAVFYPAAIGQPPEHVVFTSASKGYQQNAGFDTNHDGQITVAEISATVHQVEQAAHGRRLSVNEPPHQPGELPIPAHPPPVLAQGGGGRTGPVVAFLAAAGAAYLTVRELICRKSWRR